MIGEAMWYHLKFILEILRNVLAMLYFAIKLLKELSH